MNAGERRDLCAAHQRLEAASRMRLARLEELGRQSAAIHAEEDRLLDDLARGYRELERLRSAIGGVLVPVSRPRALEVDR